MTGESPRRGVVTRILLNLIRGYQAIRGSRPSPCRFIPSCSAYGLEAISSHGPVRGVSLTARRIARCRPGGGSGIDLVPQREQEPLHV